MVTGEELIQRKVLLPAARENIGVNVAVENIEICAGVFKKRKKMRKGAARVFFFFCRYDYVTETLPYKAEDAGFHLFP